MSTTQAPAPLAPKPIKSIPAHGGTLVDRVLTGAAREAALESAKSLTKLTLDDRAASDVELIAVGAVSPLVGFQNPADYERVVKEMRLANGLPWSIPVTLPVTADQAAALKEGQKVALHDEAGLLLAILTVESKWKADNATEARHVYRTEDEKHPGVAAILGREWLVGGSLDVVNVPPHDDFAPYRLTPAQSRAEFLKRNWRRVSAFQTRNPMHRAHRELTVQKAAMAITARPTCSSTPSSA